ESGEYLYSRWSDAPALLIERNFVASLQNRKLYAAILPPGSAAGATHLLESDLNAFEHRFREEGGSEGYIDMTYRLIDPKTKQTLSSKRFQIVAAAASGDARGGVDALSRATRELSRQSTEWLAHYLQEKP
ncbi:MAG: ABC-type transport auxiliary lipoprotein family protein, partial [Campylobacterota bacterium]